MPARISSLVSAKGKKMIHEYLMKEGVIVVRKDRKQVKHEVLDLPNLHVMRVLQSMLSRHLVVERYNWTYLYYVLNNEGIEYLRQVLQAPATVVPDTLTQKRTQRVRN